MCEVTNVKIQRLNRYPELWNGNEVPSEMFGDCFNVALYNSQSRNPQDQEEQKTLYIKMFEITKTCAEWHQTLVFYLKTPAFKHPDKTHKILQFLQEAHTPVALQLESEIFGMRQILRHHWRRTCVNQIFLRRRRNRMRACKLKLNLTLRNSPD